MMNDKQDMIRPQGSRAHNPQASVLTPGYWNEVEVALREVQETFGFVPSFVENISNQALPGAWYEVKSLYFNPNTNLEPKLKHLIGLAISTQIPCEMVHYFEQVYADATGITQQERSEASMMAGITRHWSAVLNGSLLDKTLFQEEADRMFRHVEQMMDDFRRQPPTETLFQVKPANATETYRDIENTFGLVPKFFKLFPEIGLPGAWSEFKGLQVNPFTSLSGKEKELIGLAVAAQTPCDYCTYFHRNAARLHGASDLEIQEAIAMAALTRHWSSVFHSGNMDLTSFKSDADRMILSISRQQLQS
jgi:AhpD family alkylhydroperoxidase